MKSKTTLGLIGLKLNLLKSLGSYFFVIEVNKHEI